MKLKEFVFKTEPVWFILSLLCFLLTGITQEVYGKDDVIAWFCCIDSVLCIYAWALIHIWKDKENKVMRVKI